MSYYAEFLLSEVELIPHDDAHWFVARTLAQNIISSEYEVWK